MTDAGPGPAFYILATLMVVSAVGVVTLRNMVQAALCLGMALLVAGGLYLNLNADLLAGFQVLIYVGAVVTLVLIAVMLIANIANRHIVQTNARGGLAALIAAAAGLTLCWVLGNSEWTANEAVTKAPLNPELSMQYFCWALLDKYLLPFEIASLVLLVALLGAVVVAQHTRAGEKAEALAAAEVLAARREQA